jgi:hypothetical protein
VTTGSPSLALVNNPVFFGCDGYKGYVEELLQLPTTLCLVASDPLEPSHNFGFAVYEKPNVLHYVYVKAPWRNMGVANRLIHAGLSSFKSTETVVSSTCREWGTLKMWADIAEKYKFVFNPYIRSIAGNREA